MELYQLEYFNALCYYKNYTQTAKYFGVTQPSITVAIKKLESELGSPLIDRSSRCFSLTPFGEAVLHHANVIHDEADAIRDTAKKMTNQKAAPITIGIPLTLCPGLIKSIVTLYMPAHKETPVMIYQSAAENIVEQVIHGLLDIGIVCENMLTPSCESKFLENVEFCAFFSESSKLAGLSTITAEDLTGEQLLINDTPVGVTALILEYLHKNGLQNELLHLGNLLPNDAFRLAQQGAGVAFLSKSQFATENSCYANLSPVFTIGTYLIYRKSKVLSQESKDLMRFINQYYKAKTAKP